jgi:hypothetical protein
MGCKSLVIFSLDFSEKLCQNIKLCHIYFFLVTLSVTTAVGAISLSRRGRAFHRACRAKRFGPESGETAFEPRLLGKTGHWGHLGPELVVGPFA